MESALICQEEKGTGRSHSWHDPRIHRAATTVMIS